MKARKYSHDDILQVSALVVAGVGICLLCGFSYIAWQRLGATANFNSATTGQVGDFIGGIVGTLFALSGTILLYLTLTTQRREHQRAILEMRNDQTFENCTKLISDVQARIRQFTHGDRNGVPALIAKAEDWKKEASVIHLRVALNEQVEEFQDSAIDTIVSLNGLYSKMAIALTLLEREGLDKVITDGLSLDIEDLLHQLSAIQSAVFGAEAALRTFSTISRSWSLDKRMDHHNTTMAAHYLSQIHWRHTDLRERLSALAQVDRDL